MTQWPDDTYVLIPSYKSVGAFTRFVDELTEVVPKEFICVVDDASGDGTFEFCVKAGIACLRHDVNKGKGAALRAGFSYLTGDGNVDIGPGNINTAGISINPEKINWILTMDADGQHSPADIYRFIRESKKRPAAGLCIGARDMRFGLMPPARIFSNRLTSAFLSVITGRHIKDSQCGYRLYSRGLVTSTCTQYSRFEMESEIILKAAAKNFSIRFVRVQTLYLREGSSHISHFSDTLRWIRAVLRVWHGINFKKRKF
ncbi:MAG: glycosyltransferase family 2 protein [Chitinispirillales bacterium]|jgi:glycosyltransferase involved in cell wall biosynthesis|nr:glycosyltransferase family 2 protein [Chitinispirillales bacterium]